MHISTPAESAGRRDPEYESSNRQVPRRCIRRPLRRCAAGHPGIKYHDVDAPASHAEPRIKGAPQRLTPAGEDPRSPERQIDGQRSSEVP